MTDATAADILLAFGKECLTRPAVIDHLLGLAKKYSISINSLHSSWLMMNKENTENASMPTLGQLDDLDEIIAKQLESSINSSVPLDRSHLNIKVKKEEKVYDVNSLNDFLSMGNKVKAVQNTPLRRSVQRSESNTPFKTPASKTIENLQGFSSPMTPKIDGERDLTAQFQSRKLINGPIDVFNSHIPQVSKRESGNTIRSCITIAPNQLIKGYRFMYDKLADEGMQIDESIDAVAELIAAKEIGKEKEVEEDDEFSPDALLEEEKDSTALIQRLMPPPNVPRQEEILTVGRICCDSAIENAKLNERSIVIETSRLIGNGCRIPLNLDMMITEGKSFSLFPGQIIGVRGRNPSGRLLNVSEFVYPPFPPSPTTEVSALQSWYPSDDPLSKIPLSIMTCAGPYTFNDSLDYEPLHSLIEKVQDKIPDVLILMGPFVDLNHPHIAQGKSEYDPWTLFKVQFMNRLAKLVNILPGLQIIMIPCNNDLITEWNILPQPPLGTGVSDSESKELQELLGLGVERVLMLPNPVTFCINEILVNVSNVDTLLELAGCETGRIAQNSVPDRVSLFFKHILQQRHLCPVSPSSIKIHYSQISPFVLGIKPHLLLCPSALKPGAKSVEDVLCINPGKLLKGKSSGSYSLMSLYPIDIESLASQQEEEVFCPVVDRCRACIKLIPKKNCDVEVREFKKCCETLSRSSESCDCELNTIQAAAQGVKMPKFYCDYCDVYLTHDSRSVRKSHNLGWKHRMQVQNYYSSLDPIKVETITEAIAKAYANYAPQENFYPAPQPRGTLQLPLGFPPLPPGIRPPPIGWKPPSHIPLLPGM